jgi:hypothetical protein
VSKQNHSDEKKPYEKPVLLRFTMRMEEAVLGFCKSNNSAGPSGGGCRNVNPCRLPGS